MGKNAWQIKGLGKTLVELIESISTSKSFLVEIIYRDNPAIQTEYRFNCGDTGYSVFKIFEYTNPFQRSVELQFDGSEENNLRAKKTLLNNIKGLELF